MTDYVEFRWYVAGEHRATARLAKVGAKGKWILEPDGIDQVSKLLQGFILTHAPTVSNPKELAIRMAGLAQLVRDAISRAFKSAEYDPKMRELRGVYYTPEPVVSYIVRSVDHLLNKDFGITEGFADATLLRAVSSDGKSSLQTHKVQILDPATGTGTFLHSIIDFIHESFKGNQGMWSSYVSEHLLPRLFGFELLMAPYTVAHMKLGIQLAETGYDFRGKERLGVYLTNTLEEGFEGDKLPFVEWLVEEATAAGNVKYDAPVMVVIGNPPYSGNSANNGKWTNLATDGLQILAMTLTDASLTLSGGNLSNWCRSLLLVRGPSQAVRDICEIERNC